MNQDHKEIEDLTWKAINAETKKIHDRDKHFRDLLAKLKIEHIGGN
jgi:hypothetical protein